MDPNEMLRLMRQRVSTWQESRDFEAAREAASELTMMFAELDGWLSSGGFPPEEWREGPDAGGELGPYCLDCLQSRNAHADRHCRATSTRTERRYHRWSNDSEFETRTLIDPSKKKED